MASSEAQGRNLLGSKKVLHFCGYLNDPATGLAATLSKLYAVRDSSCQEGRPSRKLGVPEPRYDELGEFLPLVAEGWCTRRR